MLFSLVKFASYQWLLIGIRLCFILSINMLNDFYRSLRRNHVPKTIGTKDETTVSRNVNRHCVNIRFGGDNKLI